VHPRSRAEISKGPDALIARLHSYLKPLGRVAIAYSGGVDSTLVLKAALDALGAENVVALLAVSPSLPQSEKEEAISLAQSLGAGLELLQTAETDDPRYQANAPNRCYFCKDHVYRALRDYSAQNGIQHVLDGMNADDTLDVRPGRAAARELHILSPLHELGFHKPDVRDAAKAKCLKIQPFRKNSPKCRSYVRFVESPSNPNPDSFGEPCILVMLSALGLP
jgi:uncharacterized protein